MKEDIHMRENQATGTLSMLSGHDVDLAKSVEEIDSKDIEKHSKDIDSKDIEWIKWMKIKKGEKNSYSNKRWQIHTTRKKPYKKQRKQKKQANERKKQAKIKLAKKSQSKWWNTKSVTKYKSK